MPTALPTKSVVSVYSSVTVPANLTNTPFGQFLCESTNFSDALFSLVQNTASNSYQGRAVVSVICDTSIMSERPECPFIGMPPRINPCTVAECKYVGGAVTAGCCQAIQEYCPSSGDPGCRSDIITNVIFSCEVFQVTGSSIISYSNDGFTTNDYSSFNCTGQPTVMPYPYQLDTCFFDPVYSQQYAKISFLNDTDLHPVYSLTLPGSLVWKYDSSSACAENTIFGYAYEPYLNNSGQLCDSRVEAPCLVNYNMDLNTK